MPLSPWAVWQDVASPVKDTAAWLGASLCHMGQLSCHSLPHLGDGLHGLITEERKSVFTQGHQNGYSDLVIQERQSKGFRSSEPGAPAQAGEQGDAKKGWGGRVLPVVSTWLYV